jgi:curved DNA-binding protein CbpA
MFMSRSYDRDPYAILGISSAATAGQIKEAYYKRARQYHPDLNKDPRAGEQMKVINWAYDILSDPEERSLYDYWRSSGIGTEYYYPGTSSPYSTEASSHTTPASAGSQTRNPPPYNPYGGRTYTNVRVTRNSSRVGCSAWGIILVIIIVITNLARALGPSLSQRPGYDYSPQFRATQAGEVARLDSAVETLHASQNLSQSGRMDTPLPSLRTSVTPSLATKVREKAEPVQEDWRSRIVPGSWEWHYISMYFPELTTPNGLSDEVTNVIYDQLHGYHIKTRSSGDYWLHINPYDNRVVPEHISPRSTATPVH